MTEQTQFEAPTWCQIYSMLLHQASEIRHSGFKPDVIVGVSRGGWIPARVLSDLLENPNLASLKVEYYVGIGKTRNSPLLAQCLSADVRGKNVLVVDEISDHGKSLRLSTDHVVQRGACEVKTATLYSKPWTAFKPDYCEKETRKWIVFPWEIRETIDQICKKHKSNTTEINAQLTRLTEVGISKRVINRFLKKSSEENQ